MKKDFFINIIILLFIGTLACNPVNSDKTINKRDTTCAIKIGAVIPLTGDIGVFGEHIKQSIMLGVEQINQRGGIKGKKVQVIYEDSKSTPREGINAITKLIDIDKVPVIIGDLSSGTTLAMAPVAEQNHVVLLANGASAPKVKNAGDYIFRNWNSDESEAKPMAEFAIKKLGYQKIGVIYAQDDYCSGLKIAFEEEYIKNGGTIVLSVPFKRGSTDMRNIILKFPAETKAIYLIGYPKDLGSFVRQSGDMKRNWKFLSSASVESDEFIRIAGENANGIIYTSPYFDPEQDTTALKFQKLYKSRYNANPDIYASVVYDALFLIANAIENKGYYADSIKTALYSTKNFLGVTGITTFDCFGDVSKPVMFKFIENGLFKKYQLQIK